MKFEAKNLSPVAFHALSQCFNWSEVAAKLLPAARTVEYAKPCEPRYPCNEVSGGK